MQPWAHDLAARGACTIESTFCAFFRRRKETEGRRVQDGVSRPVRLHALPNIPAAAWQLQETLARTRVYQQWVEGGDYLQGRKGISPCLAGGSPRHAPCIAQH